MSICRTCVDRLGRYVRQYAGTAGGFLGAGDSDGEVRDGVGCAVWMGNDYGAAGVRALSKCGALALPETCGYGVTLLMYIYT